MKHITISLSKLVVYIVKVLLPVFLGSLIFSSIVAKYNNEMNLNKSIIESAYQPMKKQFRSCMEERTKLLNTLTLYKAYINGFTEGLHEIDEAPQALINGIQKSAHRASAMGSEIEGLWKNLMMSYDALGSLFDDLAVMLTVPKESDFSKILGVRVERYELSKTKSKDIFQQLGSFELDARFVDLQKASASDLRNDSQRWIQLFEQISSLLQSLIQLEDGEFDDQADDYDEINTMTIEELRKRYQRNIFDYLMDLF